MIFLSNPSVYFLPYTWEAPTATYPAFPIVQVIGAIVVLGLATFYVARSKKKFSK
tara:strand:- start:164 stop:328 length:165 start_codon:yes stop_codon:yes gene_type:complete